MRRQLFILTTLLVWPIALLATIPPAAPVEDFTLSARKAATRADGDRMGVVATLKYEKLPDMNLGRMGHQTFATANGLMVVGGHTTELALTKTAEIYQNGRWNSINISAAHDDGFSVMLSDGSWMVGGGYAQDGHKGQSSSVDIYNPQSNSFQSGPNLTKARSNAKAINVNGEVFVSGNYEADDNTMDYYNGSSFTAVGNMDSRNNPYMMHDKDGNILVFGIFDAYDNVVDLYTYSDGSQGFVADCYNPTTGKTQYSSTIFSYSRFPLLLSNDVRPSDYHFKHNGKNYYMILANEEVSGSDDYIYKLFLYCSEDSKYYQYGDFKIPSVHPETGKEISYRSGVFVNEAKREVYLIGFSVDHLIETVHIISMNYTTGEWTIASAPGFNYELLLGSWTLLHDGRLACTGGFTDSSRHPSKEAYLFTPPTAGLGDNDTPEQKQGGKTLVVTTKGGAKTEFLLTEKPYVKFEGTNLRITSTKADFTFALADVVNFTYINTDPSGITEFAKTDDPTEISYQEGTLVLSQLKKGTVVGIYTLDGKLVGQLKADRQRTYRLSLSSLPKGVYIVKADSITTKIMKR